jgi:hypothetical protein
MERRDEWNGRVTLHALVRQGNLATFCEAHSPGCLMSQSSELKIHGDRSYDGCWMLYARGPPSVRNSKQITDCNTSPSPSPSPGSPPTPRSQLFPPGQVIGLRAGNRTGRVESHPIPVRRPCKSGCRSSPLPAMLQLPSPSLPRAAHPARRCAEVSRHFPSQQAHRRSSSGHSLLCSPLPHATELHDACQR